MSLPAPDAPISQPALVTVPVQLVEPIRREGGNVERLLLRKPRAGELRGLKIADVIQSDVGAILTLLPRICDPFITDAEAADLSAEDLAEVGGAIIGFFMSPAQKLMISQMAGSA